MKKIVKTTFVRGCYEYGENHKKCPYWTSVANGDWYCMNSHRMIAAFPSPMSNIIPFVDKIPDWCELEDDC